MTPKTIEQAVVDLNSEVVAMSVLQSLILADLATKSGDPVDYLERLSDSASALVVSVTSKFAGEEAEAQQASILASIQTKLDLLAGLIAKVHK